MKDSFCLISPTNGIIHPIISLFFFSNYFQFVKLNATTSQMFFHIAVYKISGMILQANEGNAATYQINQSK